MQWLKQRIGLEQISNCSRNKLVCVREVSAVDFAIAPKIKGSIQEHLEYQKTTINFLSAVRDVTDQVV